MNLPTDMIATSAGWGLHKPDRRFFERIVSEVGWKPEEIAYVGDRIDNDVLPAAAVGLIPIHLIRGPWGWLQRDLPGVAVARGQIRGLGQVGSLLQGL
jgi:FMN phosphatase YigB (HAD superfamily)